MKAGVLDLQQLRVWSFSTRGRQHHLLLVVSLLQPVLEHRPVDLVDLVEHVTADLHDTLWSDPEDVHGERCMVDLAQRKAVPNCGSSPGRSKAEARRIRARPRDAGAPARSREVDQTADGRELARRRCAGSKGSLAAIAYAPSRPFALKSATGPAPRGEGPSRPMLVRYHRLSP